MRDALQHTFSRRSLLRGLAAVPALTMLPNVASKHGFLYEAAGNFIHLKRVDAANIAHQQSMESNRPAALAIHPSGRYLYAANDVAEHAGRARGTVETFAIHRLSGRLTKIGLQPLSLSATRPRSIAIAPAADCLLVAAYGGGIYNMLPITDEGVLASASAILKEIGAGPHPVRQNSAHPHSVIFDRSGRYAISSDLGCDWVSVWRVEQNKLMRVSRLHLKPGAGPGSLALQAGGKFLTLRHELAGTTSTHPYDSETGTVGPAIFHERLRPLSAPSTVAFLAD